MTWGRALRRWASEGVSFAEKPWKTVSYVWMRVAPEVREDSYQCSWVGNMEGLASYWTLIMYVCGVSFVGEEEEEEVERSERKKRRIREAIVVESESEVSLERSRGIKRREAVCGYQL